MFFTYIHKYTFIIWISCSLFIFCQIDSVSDNNIYIDNNLLDEVLLDDSLNRFNKNINYLLLKHRVIKVYPYADSIVQIVRAVNIELESFSSKRFSRRYLRKMQRELINRFRYDIVNLSRKEGVILSKIIYRQLNMTAYEIISSYRGSWRAFFWQSLSRLYSGDLKTIFNPRKNREDVLIDAIICRYIEK